MGVDDLNLEDYDASTGSNAGIDMFHDASQSAEDVLLHSEYMEDAEALKYQHPDYTAFLHKWHKYIDCYRANDVYRFIKQHPREHQDVYNQRVLRGYYFNYVASIVDLFVAYLFEAGITRTPGKNMESELKEFWEDCDCGGMQYTLFMQIAATFAVCCGHVGILVDMPQAPDEGFANESARKNAKHRPYLTLIKASQILDWELDTAGKFEWVKIEEFPPTGRTWKSSIDNDTRFFVIWTKSTWERWKYEVDAAGDDDDPLGKAVKIGSGEHRLGEVPLVILKNAKDLEHPWFGDSAVRDIVDINLAILNWCSFADEEIANRCMNILAMQRNETDAPVEISHYNVLEYAEGATPPQYLTPGDTPLKLIWEAVALGRDEIYRLSKLSGSTGLLGVREATSGIAYAFEFNETNQSLGKKAEFLEQAEKEIHRLLGKWLGQEYDGLVAYPREFGVDDFLAEMNLLAQARATLSSETAIKELETRILSKMFSKEKQELRSKIAAEVRSSAPKDTENFESLGNVDPALISGESQESQQKDSESQEETATTAEE